jgi:hypothetical protein
MSTRRHDASIDMLIDHRSVAVPGFGPENKRAAPDI